MFETERIHERERKGSLLIIRYARGASPLSCVKVAWKEKDGER
jgi:hypothetical protein